MIEKAQILDDKAVGRAIARISFEILERNKGTKDLCIVGILSRGIDIANRISNKIFDVEGVKVPVGLLDITKFRDDNKIVANTEDLTNIDFNITGKKVVLVDDVLYTGRSVRAAIDALMSKGRPNNIQFAALVDRGHRELPIRADYIGKNLPTSKDELVEVNIKEKDGIDSVVILSDK